jgi:hypothetical protein
MMNLVVKHSNAWLFVFLAVAAHAQSDSGGNTSSSNSSETGDPGDDTMGWIPAAEYKQPPWGFSSYGNVDEYGSAYLAAAGFALDIVRPGWSWHSNRQGAQLVAPFCYDIVPGYMTTCFTDAVQEHCTTSGLQGTPAYGNLFCISNQPHTIVGPVCWNRTCYGEQTRQACTAVAKDEDTAAGAWYVGVGPHTSRFATPDGVVQESLDVGWCVVPGNHHTVFGPACYGLECYTDDLVAACQKLHGVNFADRFCLFLGSIVYRGWPGMHA